MAVLGRFVKQPSEVLDYDVDFTDWFDGRTDTPSSHVVIAETGITVVGSSRTSNVVKVILSGGVAGTKYKVTVRLTTNTFLVKEAEFVVSIKEY
jgi:hypothetical protein